MYEAIGWNTMEETVSMLSLQWLGHVARMPIWRIPKQALFGWIDEGMVQRIFSLGSKRNTIVSPSYGTRFSAGGTVKRSYDDPGVYRLAIEGSGPQPRHFF